MVSCKQQPKAPGDENSRRHLRPRRHCFVPGVWIFGASRELKQDSPHDDNSTRCQDLWLTATEYVVSGHYNRLVVVSCLETEVAF